MHRATQDNLQPESSDEANKLPAKASGTVGQRVITSVIAIPIVLLFAWFGGWWSFAAIAFVVILGTNELHQMMLQSKYHPVFAVTLGLSLLFLVAAMLPQQRLLILEIGVSAALVISFLWLFMREKLDGALLDWSLTFAFSIYLGWPMSFFLLLRGYTFSLWPLSRGVLWLLVVLLGVWATDSAAFFTGRYFGRHKLIPKISPAKTWEGAVGGMLAAVIASLILTVGPLGVPWYIAIVMGLAIGLAAIVGDLAESLLKRQSHVKDSGFIMPGHGGMLDRIDSLLFAVMVVYFFALFLGL